MKILHRLYHDFCMPSQLDRYKKLLMTAKKNGYEFVTIKDFWERIKANKVNDSKFFIIRHDVDLAKRTNKRMWSIDKELGIASTYYFKLSTIDVALMKEIETSGAEASYHYEELATIAKHNGFRNSNIVAQHLSEIRDLFKSNLLRLRDITGLAMVTVASHGDFANRKLGMPNHILLNDKSFREACHVSLEAYDDDFMRFITSRHVDGFPPQFWYPSSPIDAINRNERIIYCLIHPNNWEADILENIRIDCSRLFEEFLWLFKSSS